MGLAAEILADFQSLLTEHGVKAKWKSIDLLVLISRVRNEQQIDVGGFVETPDLSLRVAKVSFRSATPKFGERIEVDGTAYRISKVSAHTRSPILNLSLTTTDE